MSPAIYFLGRRAPAPTSIDATACTQVWWSSPPEDDEPSAAHRLAFPRQSEGGDADAGPANADDVPARDNERSPRDHRARAFRLDELTPPPPADPGDVAIPTAIARPVRVARSTDETRPDLLAPIRARATRTTAMTSIEDAASTRSWRVARPPRLAFVVALAIAALIVPIVAPLCWTTARDELRAIECGAALPRYRGALRAMHVWGEWWTFLAIGFAVGHVVGLIAR